MIINFADFSNRRAYLVGLSEHHKLKKYEDMDVHIGSAVAGLAGWGLSDRDIRVINETNMPDFNEKEFASVLREQENSGGAKSLVFLYFRGHSTVKSGCIHAAASDPNG